MKKVLALVSSLLLVATFATPAQSAGAKYSVYQKTLSAFSSSATTLTSQQKAQVKAAVEANPTAEKFICTGIRYYDQPMSVNITVRKRAKAACDYAKQLNPALSTWYQNKPTQARSYAGKVLLTVKSPDARELANQLSLDADICKLPENSRARKLGATVPDYSNQLEIQGRYTGNATAFPFAPTVLPTEGIIDVEFIFVDWEDLPGTQSDYDYYTEQARLFEDFYWMASEHKLDMRLHISDQWFRIPGSYKDFTTLTPEEEAQRGEAPKKQVFYDAAIAASDPSTDFSDTQIVYFAVPTSKSVFSQGPHEFSFDYNGYLNTQEGLIYNTATAGDFNIDKGHDGASPWFYYVHETGHMLGIPHQANEDENKPFVEKYVVSPLGGWDVMAEHGANRTLSSWLRWLAGWLEDDQVVCVTKESLTSNTFELHPINTVSGEVESLVIKLNETKAVVVESRRYDPKFDIFSGNPKDGLLVYTVDATRSSAQGSQVVLSPRDITKYLEEKNTWPDWRELDGMFFQGDSLVFEGIKIEALSIGATSDLVRVTRVD
jgi:M6 family metalloprotease-like protein